MQFKDIYINSIAAYEPHEFLTSTSLEQMLSPTYDRLKLPYGRLKLQTGIESRGVYPQGIKPSDISTGAARKVLADSNKDDIDLLIHSSVCRDFLEPSTASVVHHQLGLSALTQSFDLSNACLGFLNAMSVAANMIQSGSIKKALIVTGENASPLIYKTVEKLNNDKSLTRKSIKKYIANLTIGSAGVAAILSQEKKGIELLCQSSLSDTNDVTLCQGDGNADELMMETDSPALLHAGISLAKKNWDRFVVENNWQHTDKYLCHQVGVAHQNLLYDTLALDKSKDFSTFATYGNTGSAAMPLTLVKALESKSLTSGDRINFLGIGSGLHSSILGAKVL